MKNTMLEEGMKEHLDSKYTDKSKKPQKKDEGYIKSRNKLLMQYLENKPFEFNINTDKLYSQYADQYKRQGEAAMRDTVANAAANTGGYTSSYGISAGAQAYQSYLDRLNEIIPVLEQNAYDRYRDNEEKLKEGMDILDGFDNKEYSEYRDDMDDYKDERDYYRGIYEYDKDSDYDMYRLLTDYFLAMTELESKKEEFRENLDFKNKELDFEKDKESYNRKKDEEDKKAKELMRLLLAQ